MTADSDDASQHARCCRDQYAQRPCPGRLRRDEKQHRHHRGKREHGCGMPARIGKDAQVGAVDQGLEQAIVQPDGRRKSCRGKHGAVKPAGEQAGDDNGCAQHARRNQRTRSGKPWQETPMAAEPGNDRRVDGVIEPSALAWCANSTPSRATRIAQQASSAPAQGRAEAASRGRPGRRRRPSMALLSDACSERGARTRLPSLRVLIPRKAAAAYSRRSGSLELQVAAAS